MKILILTHNYIRSKKDYAGIFLHTLFKYLISNNYQVSVIVPHQKGLSRFDVFDGIQIYRPKYAPEKLEKIGYGKAKEQSLKNPITIITLFSFLLSFFIYSCFLIKDKKIDVISSQWWIPCGLIGWLVSLWTRKPLIISLHGTDYKMLKQFGFFNPLLKFMFKRVSYITVSSSFIKKGLVEKNLINPDKVVVLPMPVNVEIFKENFEK